MHFEDFLKHLLNAQVLPLIILIFLLVVLIFVGGVDFAYFTSFLLTFWEDVQGCVSRHFKKLVGNSKIPYRQ